MYAYCRLSKICPRKYTHPRKYAQPRFLLKVIAKGHLLLESTPTQQTKIICSSMHSGEIRVYVWASS